MQVFVWFYVNSGTTGGLVQRPVFEERVEVARILRHTFHQGGRRQQLRRSIIFGLGSVFCLSLRMVTLKLGVALGVQTIFRFGP